eukprot:5459637-Pleurochrysis_carterae.AAC.2
MKVARKPAYRQPRQRQCRWLHPDERKQHARRYSDRQTTFRAMYFQHQARANARSSDLKLDFKVYG